MEYASGRFVPEQQGGIELQHLHRYLCVADLSVQKDVLDIGSGEGRGSAILAKVARSTIGVEVSEEMIRRATEKYRSPNLTFRHGSATQVPVPDASIDVVVSFATSESHDQRIAVMAEIKRVLRPGGLLVMARPNKLVSANTADHSDSQQVRGVTRVEFDSLLKSFFTNVSMHGQRVVYGSTILGEEGGLPVSFANHNGDVVRATGLVDPTCLIASASDGELPVLNSGVFYAHLEEAEAMLQTKHPVASGNQEGLDLSENYSRSESMFPRNDRTRDDVQQITSQDVHALYSADPVPAAQRERLSAGDNARDEHLERLREMQELLDAAHRDVRMSQSQLADAMLEKKELSASVSRLSASVGQLNAAVSAYRTSFSWRVTAPLRMGKQFVRKVATVALIPYRMARLAGSPRFVQVKDIEKVADGYVSTGNDSQFSVLPGWSGLRAGWALFTVEMTSDEGKLSPILYAFAGDDGSQVFSFPIYGYFRGRQKRLIILPPGTRSLRFDPTDKKGVNFNITHLSVRNLGKLSLIREGYSALDAERRKGLWKAVLGCNLRAAKEIVRSGVVGQYDKGEYHAWVELYDTLTERDLTQLRAAGEALAVKPSISVLMPVYNPRPKYLRKALDSVLAQTYPHWELCIADDASTNPEVRSVLEQYARKDGRIKVVFREQNGHISAASNSALDLVKGEFVALMDHDDLLPAHALFMVAEEINRSPEAELIYTDEDKVDENDIRHDPHFKTDWNRELLYSQNFIAHMGVYRTELVRKIGGFRVGFEGSQDYDFVLRFLLHTTDERIRHIPHVLYHWRIFPGVTSFSTDNPDASVDTARRALVEYFEQAEPTAEVLPIGQFPGWWRIKRRPPAILPRVSLIVPTRDRLEVLEVAVKGLLRETDYPNLEIIVVDNDSTDPATLAFFDQIRDDPRVRVLRISGAFNFSALNNRAAEIATGAILGFINNDIQVIHKDWLMELVTQATQRNVGAVGAKLYYANDTIQHAGVVMGLYGVAGHGHRHFPRNSIGYFGRPMLVQNTSAVTAACMLVPRLVFDQVGGYDEINLTVGYNDVDLCLKIRSAGYNIVFTPFAELYHLESVSRGENLTSAQIERDAKERAYMLSRWSSVIARDPFYSPNLTIASEDYSLAFPPRTSKSWKNK